MAQAGWSQHELAKRSGVSQSQVGNILNRRTSCSVETAEALAKPFGLQGWHLILPNLPDELVHSISIERLVTAYTGAGEETRDYLDRIAEREIQYGKG